MADLWIACCVIKILENSLSGSVNLFKGVNVIDIRTKWLGDFCTFELSRVNLSHGNQNWFELSGVSRNRVYTTLLSFARIKRPIWRPVELNDRHLRSHGKIGDCEQSSKQKGLTTVFDTILTGRQSGYITVFVWESDST